MDMKQAKAKYERPQVKRTYSRPELEKAVRPHGQISGYGIAGNGSTAP